MHNYESIDLKFGVGDCVTLPSLVAIRSTVVPPRDGEIKGLCALHYLVVLFLATRTAHTREPIFTHMGFKDAVWR